MRGAGPDGKDVAIVAFPTRGFETIASAEQFASTFPVTVLSTQLQIRDGEPPSGLVGYLV